MELLEDGVSLWKGAIFGFQPSVFGGVSPDFWWLDGLDWKQLFLSWSYQIRSLGQLAACLFKIVVVQPMINRLDTVPPPNGQYVNSTFITELDVYNPPTVIWGKGSSFWTTFKVIQIPPPHVVKAFSRGRETRGLSFFSFGWFLLPLSWYESSHQELLLSLVCAFFVVIFESRWTEQDELFDIFESSLCFCVVICKTNLDGKQHLSLFFSEKVIIFVSIPKTHSYSFRGCVTWMLGPENPASSTVIHMLLGMFKADISWI